MDVGRLRLSLSGLHSLCLSQQPEEGLKATAISQANSLACTELAAPQSQYWSQKDIPWWNLTRLQTWEAQNSAWWGIPRLEESLLVSRSRQPPGECCNPAEAAGESPRSIGIPCVISLHSTAWHRTYSLLVCVFRLQKLVEKNATTWSCTAHRSAAVGTITARNHRQLRRIFFSPTGLSESALR